MEKRMATSSRPELEHRILQNNRRPTTTMVPGPQWTGWFSCETARESVACMGREGAGGGAINAPSARQAAAAAAVVKMKNAPPKEQALNLPSSTVSVTPFFSGMLSRFGTIDALWIHFLNYSREATWEMDIIKEVLPWHLLNESEKRVAIEAQRIRDTTMSSHLFLTANNRHQQHRREGQY